MYFWTFRARLRKVEKSFLQVIKRMLFLIVLRSVQEAAVSKSVTLLSSSWHPRKA